MPLISTIGRKAWPVRLLIAVLYTLLIAGGITMIYPLVLMISGSVKGTFDAKDVELVPRFLVDDTVFFKRYLESKYGSITILNIAWNRDFADWKEIEIPTPVSPRQLDDFDKFRRARDLPTEWVLLGHVGNSGQNSLGFVSQLLHENGTDLGRLSRVLGMKFSNWSEVVLKQRPYTRSMALWDPLIERTDRFKAARPVEDLVLLDVEGLWKSTALRPRYSGSLDDYSRALGRRLVSWDDAHLGRTAPPSSAPVERGDWESFVRSRVAFVFLRVDPAAQTAYRSFLRQAHENDIQLLNKVYGTAYRTFDEVPLPAPSELRGTRFVDFNQFIREKVPLDQLALDGPNFRYADFVRRTFHGDLSAVRGAYGVGWSDFREASLPVAAMDWRDFQRQKTHFRWQFLAGNYQYVLDFVARHGRGVQNTVILCMLTILVHLIVNPLAAYALSRFGLPSTYKFLLFFMATIAFPGEVMMIPSFLQLKEFGLLNTFAALILPGLANGFSIFLLKGFFDSLPRELYESAMMDGASELRIFFNITLSLSKPILAVLALGSFTSAFSAFFFAIIICPDEKMWTLMVWLYQLQQIANSQSINYAALCLASIPTLLIFVFCQRIIMRGIVVPVEK